MMTTHKQKMHGTTIVAVHKDGVTAIAGDGQVTLGDTIMKKGAIKVRTLQDGNVVVGFAGVVSDAFTLLEKFEGYLESSKNNLLKAAVDTVKEWRTDKMLRDLEAMLIVGDKDQLLVLSGNGDVILPDDNVLATGSGGIYAQAAALALLKHTSMDAVAIAKEAMVIATDIDIYSSGHITVLHVGELDGDETDGDEAGKDETDKDETNRDKENADQKDAGQEDIGTTTQNAAQTDALEVTKETTIIPKDTQAKTTAEATVKTNSESIQTTDPTESES